MRDYLTVVTGHPRSGTSMMMQMLAGGGLPVLVSEESSKPDAGNPGGYWQYDQSDLMVFKGAYDYYHPPANLEWARKATGAAVKVLQYRIDLLPPEIDVRVIVMSREPTAVARSIQRLVGVYNPQLLDCHPVLSRTDVLAHTVANGISTGVFLLSRCRWPVLEVDYDSVLNDPTQEALRVSTFLGGLEVEKMVAEQLKGISR